MLFGEYLNQVHEMDLMINLYQLFGATRDQQFGCTTVFDKLKCYYCDYKDADKDSIEQVISMYIGKDDKKYYGSHIADHKSEYYYSMYNQPWKLLPFYEVMFENCEMTPEEVVATVIWELTWWGFNEPEYEGLTFHFISDTNDAIRM